MPLPVAAGIISGVGSLLGGLLGGSSDAYDEAKGEYDRVMQELSEIGVPSVEAQQIALQQIRKMGTFTPEMEAAIVQGPSSMEQVSTDPRLKSAQMAALTSMQRRGEEGFTPVEMAELAQLQRSVGAQERARQESILQGMQQRGVAGSGAELAAQLSSSQAAAERQAQQSQSMAAQAYQQALNSMMQSGQLAGSMRTQEFGEQSDVARARDEIARANTMNQRDVQMRNIGSRNVAGAQDLAEQQRIAEQNVALANQQQIYNKQLQQKEFENRLSKNKAKAGMAGDLMTAAAGEEKRSEERGAAIGSGIGTALGEVGTYGAEKGWFKSSNDELPTKKLPTKKSSINKLPTKKLISGYDDTGNFGNFA